MPKEVNKNDYVRVEPGEGRCVDERRALGLHSENFSVQMPGVSEHLMDLILLPIALTTGEQVDESLLFDMTENVYKSPFASEYGARPGLHIDDDHGSLSLDQTGGRVLGCGADKVRTNVLKKMGAKVVYQTGARIAEGRRRGWGIQVLTGAHDPHATAALNYLEGKTLNTKSLWEAGRRPSFNHDLWFALGLLDELAGQLDSHGFNKAAKELSDHGEDWSIDMYTHTLQELGYHTNLIQIY